MDTTPLETDLLRHRDFLLRLATGLVGGNDAEDLVQDVWAKALTHPPESGASGRGWLARVARNLAVNRFRARSRRQSRERDAARPEAASDSFAELDERFELGHSVAAAVRALDEPYRAVILLRFFEGLEPAEIAARLELPLATVRTRQQRALARLRERLDREHGGREAWSLALGAWLGRGTAVSPSVASGIGLAKVGGVAVALVAMALWTLRSHVGEVITSDPFGNPVPMLPPLATTTPVPGAGGGAREMLPSSVLPSARTLLVGRVVGLSAAELRESRLTADAEWKRYAIDAPPVAGLLGDDGRFEIEVDSLLRFSRQPADELVAWLDHPLHLVATKTVAATAGVRHASGDTLLDVGEVVPAAAAVVRGEVRLPDGTPAAGAPVVGYYLDKGVPRHDRAASASCDAEGRYDLRFERGGECLLAVLLEGVRPASMATATRLGRAVELGTTRLEAGQTILGRVTRLGNPMPHAEVNVIARPPGDYLDGSGGSSIGWSEGRVEWTHVRVEADEQGGFRCSGLAAADYALDAQGDSRIGSLGFLHDSIPVTAPAAGVALEFRASLISFERTSESPQEVTGKIRVKQAGREECWFWFQRASDLPRTTFAAPPDTPLSLRVELEGLPPISLEIVTPGPGQELLRTLSFATPGPLAALELEWLPDPKFAPDAFRVYFESPEAVELFDRGFHATDAVEGVFRVADVPPGRYRVRIHAGWDHLERTAALDRVLAVQLEAGQTTRERLEFELGGILRVDVRAPSGERCTARFRLLGADGEPREVEFQTRRENGVLSETWQLSPWGEHECETLPAGDYTLVLWDDDVVEQRVPVRVVAGETTEVTVTLQPK